ncbi:hypothetical protein B6D60_02335 [candidate division KSB1 bacterium 4484_87]|nr:MAG: hypothetical protein B6D60_02335 [candidate division KSB1 bacterium 4484_87]
MKKQIFITVISFFVLFFACNVNVNKGIDIKDGQIVDHSLNTVNGFIKIGNNCAIKGDVRSVNGGVGIGSHTKTGSVHTVNGAITIGDSSFVEGNLNVINGKIDCGLGTKIHGSVKTINGNIELTGVRVRNDVATANGDITLKQATMVEGDIVIKKSKGNLDKVRQCTILITDNSVVTGNIIVKDEKVQVTVHLQNGGKVLGKVENAEVVSD